MTLLYDNMCNLNKLKASRSPLPFNSPLDKMWINVDKIIDVFHFSNHISPLCRQQYSPEAVKKVHPDWNTQAGKHTICSMPKFHHLFFIHRMVIRCNAYTAKCYEYGRKPVLPDHLLFFVLFLLLLLLFCSHHNYLLATYRQHSQSSRF